MDLSKLTPEEREALKQQFLKEEKNKEEKKREEREGYKILVDQFVIGSLEILKELSEQMILIKKNIFEEAETLIDLKNDLFKVKPERRSDTFTTQDGKMSITLGNRINEGWDDTVNAGIEKVKQYLNSLAKDENSAALVETVMGLISKDRKGNLKANKVLELEKLAIRTQDPTFLDGIAIIKAAFRPTPTCQFIDVTLKDENGNDVKLPLSLSAINK